MVKISRRDALLGTVLAGTAACSSKTDLGRFVSPSPVPVKGFAHGVASGDPQVGSVILWTRLTPEDPTMASDVDVQLEIAEDEGFQTIIQRHTLYTSGARDFTVKYLATDLSPAKAYFFRFSHGDHASPIGRTKTLPAGSVEDARFAVVSCSNWQQGFFNAYDHISRQDGFDAVIHLGDYFYEYGHDGYGGESGKKLGRQHEPAHEVITLEDYRQRHAQYKTDASLQAMHQRFPMICLWDDHEVANNSWEGGAENHDLSEGEWDDRRRAAMQAYYEWMPVREPEMDRPREHLYRAYSYGDLLTITSVETRLTARAEQIELEDHSPNFNSKEDVENFLNDVVGANERYMLGDAQLNYVVDSMKASKDQDQPWRIIANQILMADVRSPDLTPHVSEEVIQKIEPAWAGIRDFLKNSAYRLPLYLDSWGGYPVARERLYDALDAKGVNDVIVLTGDAHEFWVNDLYSDDEKKMGVELGTTSITSDTVQEFLGDGTKGYALLMTKDNKCVRYYDPLHHGYIDLTLTKDRGQAKLIGLDTVKSREYTAEVTAAFDLKRKKGSVYFDKPKHLNFKERFVY